MLEQPVTGYRAGMDAALLAAAAAAQPGDTAIELGCGAGAVLVSLAVRRPGLLVCGVERQTAMADLARRNVARNALDDRASVREADGLVPVPDVDGRNAIALANPPFFDDLKAVRAPHPARLHAYVADAPLEAWVTALLRLTAPRGRLVMIHRADRLGDMLAALGGRAGDVCVHPVRPFPDAPAKRVVVIARRQARGPLRLHPGLVLHPGRGVAGFTPEAQAILDGAPWEVARGD
jgi:tRNA1(Val) A37 N6-methylase TrmN6